MKEKRKLLSRIKKEQRREEIEERGRGEEGKKERKTSRKREEKEVVRRGLVTYLQSKDDNQMMAISPKGKQTEE